MTVAVQSIQDLQDFFDRERPRMAGLADSVWSLAELRYAERGSAQLHIDGLAAAGFRITRDVAGISTAFMAEWGDEGPVLAFLGEYDALSGLNQQSGALVCQPSVDSPGLAGHGCGHHLLGTAAHFAAIALQEHLRRSGQQARVRFYGCPAEEIMSGKIVMNDQEVFDDLDVAITWHPFDRNRVSNDIWQAQDIKNYTFHGISSHAAKAPEKGRSALDAAELMNVGVNYLREHVPGDVRMHYAYIDNGLPANVVPDIAKTNYFIRSYLRSRTEDASERVDNCARGAALMTDTTVDIELVASCSEMKVNRVLTELYYDAMTQVPTPTYTPEELDFAKQITEEAGLINDGTLFSGLEPLEDEPVPIAIGTDASQVSHTIPLITLSAATMCKGTPLHHWAAAKQAGMTIGQKGMLYVARCMAEGTKLLMETPGSIEKAWELHKLTP